MKPAGRRRTSAPAPIRGIAELRARLHDAEAAIAAIRAGEVDAVVVAGGAGPQVFTLEGAGHPYRVLIESMNEGALTLTADAVILYANESFAKMVKTPLEQVMGTSFLRLLSAADTAALRPLLKRPAVSGTKIQVLLQAGDGSTVPAQVSIRRLPKRSSGNASIGFVVTDMTDARRNEQMLRALTHRVVQVQESERARVALELHDHITQLLCVVLLRSRALAGHISARDGTAREEAKKLREELGQAAEEVERISRNLRPGVLEQLGLVVVLRSAGAEFADRTGVPVKVECVALPARLPADIELALYRVLQDALRNVEQHARAGHVTVGLTRPGDFVQLSINDDGIGFDPDDHSAEPETDRGLGLLSMGERAAYVGGTLAVRSAPGNGTTVRARIPFTAGGAGASRR